MSPAQLKLIAASGRFKPEEFLAGAENLKLPFLKSFLAWRDWHGCPTLITSAWRDSKTSAHGKGVALDVILFEPGKYLVQTLSPEHLWNVATLWPFAGVGMYFDWQLTYRDGMRRQALGVHVDLLADPKKRPLRWVRVNGEYRYLDPRTGLFGGRQRPW
jgi:hypothetical protein